MTESRTKNQEPGRVASERRTGLLGGGLLTDNVVFISDQRVFVLKRTAVLMLATWNMQLATALSNKQLFSQERLLAI